MSPLEPRLTDAEQVSIYADKAMRLIAANANKSGAARRAGIAAALVYAVLDLAEAIRGRS